MNGFGKSKFRIKKNCNQRCSLHNAGLGRPDEFYIKPMKGFCEPDHSQIYSNCFFKHFLSFWRIFLRFVLCHGGSLDALKNK